MLKMQRSLFKGNKKNDELLSSTQGGNSNFLETHRLFRSAKNPFSRAVSLIILSFCSSPRGTQHRVPADFKQTFHQRSARVVSIRNVMLSHPSIHPSIHLFAAIDYSRISKSMMVMSKARNQIRQRTGGVESLGRVLLLRCVCSSFERERAARDSPQQRSVTLLEWWLALTTSSKGFLTTAELDEDTVVDTVVRLGFTPCEVLRRRYGRRQFKNGEEEESAVDEGGNSGIPLPRRRADLVSSILGPAFERVGRSASQGLVVVLLRRRRCTGSQADPCVRVERSRNESPCAVPRPRCPWRQAYWGSWPPRIHVEVDLQRSHEP